MNTANVRRRVLLACAVVAVLWTSHAPPLLGADEAPYTLYFAEGAAGIFRTRYLIANPDPNHAVTATLSFLNDDGSGVTLPVDVPARGRVTVEGSDVEGLSNAFALEIRSDAPLAAERVMDWLDGAAGSHAERAIEAPALSWFFAEGATIPPFDLFYLIGNPGNDTAVVEATFLRPAPLPPITRIYTVARRSRLTIWARHVDSALESAEFSAAFTASRPVVAERAQYMVKDGQFHGGHAAAGAPALSTDWYFAEGATGEVFDTFLLLANPSTWTAEVAVSFLLPAGERIEREYQLPPGSRTTVWLDQVDPLLSDTAVSTRVRVTNGVRIAAERAMWWPVESASWRDGHVSAGATATAQRWVVAGGESGTARGDDTFLLLANLSEYAGTVRVTLGYEDGGSESSRVFAVEGESRLNVWPGADFPESKGRSFAIVVETLGTDALALAVESSVYTVDSSGLATGTNTLATPVQSALAASTTVTIAVGNETLVSTVDRVLSPWSIVLGEVADPSLVDAMVDAASGDVLVTPRGTASGVTTLTVRLLENGHVVGTRTHTVQVVGGPIVFGESHRVLLGLFPDFAGPSVEGRVAPFGTRLNSQGHLEPVDLASIGLQDLLPDVFDTLRETRLADFNGDGVLDLIAVYYRGVEETSYSARLFFGQADGTFVEDQGFRQRGLRGYGHTIVVADFDNDGDLDVFIPAYSHYHVEAQNFFLRNDGTGQFDEIADQAGVAMRGWPVDYRVEGAQAVDFDGDGWIDIYTASHLFRNNGDMTFTDVAGALRLFDDLDVPAMFDEGARFTDWNNDGHLDLVLHHPFFGPRLFEFDGQRFRWRQVFTPQDPSDLYFQSYGLNIADINGDGLEDVVLAGGPFGPTVVMKNVGVGFVREATAIDAWTGDALAFGDIDGDGRIDLFNRRANVGDSAYALNATPGGTLALHVTIVGAGGAMNQAGRVVRVSPLSRPDVMYTRVVDSGSGYLAKNQYELLIPVPFDEPHLIKAAFDHGEVTALAMPGDRLVIHRDGLVQRQ